jgi:CHAT domain-containing protein
LPPARGAVGGCLAVLLLLVRGAAGEGVVEQGPLAPGAPREGEVAPGADHVFTVASEPGHVYEVRVQQLGTNLDVRWVADGQNGRAEKRLGRSGEEVVWWVAQGGAPATVTVKTAVQRRARYHISLAPPRPATASDLERQAVEKDFAGRDPAALRRAADGFGRIGLADRRAMALDRLSVIAEDRGDYALARRSALECVDFTRKAGMEEYLAKCLLGVGASAAAAGEMDAAESAYREAVAVRERLGDPGPLAVALHDLGSRALVPRGEYTAADALLRRALDLAQEEGDGLVVAVAGASLSSIAAYRGDLETAVDAMERARDAGRRHGRADIEVLAAANVGLMYNHLGDFDRALARLREAAPVAEAKGLKPALAFIRLSMGGAYEDTGDLDAAVRELEAGIALAREIGHPEWVANGEQLLGWTLARLGRSAAAEEHFAAGLASAATQGNSQATGSVNLYLGKARLLAGRSADAEAPLLDAQRRFSETGSVDAEARAWMALAELSHARGEWAAALERVERALAGFESVRARVALGDQRAHYAAYRREAYDLAVGILVDRERAEPGRGHIARAFEMTERARGRSLLEEVAARRTASPQVPADLLRRQRAALDRIGHLQRDLISRHTTPNVDGVDRVDRKALAELEGRITAAVAEEEAARRAIRAASPRSRDGQPPTLSAAALSSGLDADEALLEYHVGTRGSWLFVVTRSRLEVHALPGEAALRRDVEALLAQLSRPSLLGAPAYAALAHRLYDTLIGRPAGRLEGIRRLRVVPDGPLWEIPFEALVTEAGGSRYRDLAYLLRRWTVVYEPSAGHRASLPPAPARDAAAPELVAFADPQLASQVEGAAAVARVERAVFREGDRWSLPPLPCAAREAREVAALFGPGRSRVYLGEAARESLVKSTGEVARSRYLLFSTHALLSETMPGQSSLVLSPTVEPPEDGLLQGHEIDGLALQAELVVLSACESALGRNLRGEGLLGLARSFLQAGARGLVASLWRVADCSTADLVTAFLARLRDAPGTAPRALRDAKTGLLRGRYAHPYYWAGFVLVGGS